MNHRQNAPFTMKHNPCCLCILENPATKQLLMIKHLRGINKGYYNFPGGKMELGETIIDSAIREMKEETGLTLHNAKCIGRIDIKPQENTGANYFAGDDMHVYLCYSNKFSGEIKAAENEVDAFWQDRDNIPYDNMRDNDKIWIPEVLEGKTIHKVFFRGDDGNLKDTEHDDEDVESLLEMRQIHFEMMKMAYQRR